MADLTTPPRSNPAAAFENKIRLSRWAQLFERLWPRTWALLAVVALFVLVSLAGLWPRIPETAHYALLGVFGLATLAALFWMARTPFPSREEALRRLEQRSSVPHRPASSYEDTLSAPDVGGATEALWQAHRARLAATLAKLRVGTPSPRADRADPWALRAVLLIGVGVLAAAVGDGFMDRLSQAFRFGTPATAVSTARLDAWVTPPAYTARPPLMLVDGSRASAPPVLGEAIPSFEVPTKSALAVRASGEGAASMTLEVADESGKVEILSPKKAQLPPGLTTTAEVAEIRVELTRPVTVRARGVSGEPQWAFRIIPDHLPKISLTKDPERMPRGSLKLTYKVEDDYGIASAEARITRVRPKPGDPATSWARPKKLGARPPLEKPPVLTLRLPRTNAKQAEGTSYHELSGHPWAGMRVRMVLSAKDQAGQIGKSEPVEFILPQRRFDNPIARAVVEQRRYLIEDPRNREQVLVGIDAIAAEPEGFFPDYSAYISLRGAYWRLMRDRSRDGMKSVVDQLWHVALRLEDGNLSEAERRLRQAQEDLAKALQEGASDEEIQRLMNELRQALNQFMEQLARQAEGQPPQPMPQGQQNQILSQRDLERMMRDIENMARQGSRDNAQQMLSQLRDLLERLQSGRMARQQGQQNQQLMQTMDQFGDVIRQQQQLLDDTFNEQREAGEDSQEGQQGQQGQQGQRGQRGQQGQGQQGQRGQRGQRGQQQGQGQGEGRGQQQGELSRRQGQLRDRLGQLGQSMQQLGMQPPSQFGGAQRSMEEAEEALRNGDLDGAARAEQQALEQLRQGAQQMAQQMLQQMPGQFGRSADVPLDPMGRPQRTEGPDLGTSVKVPDEIDIQRAREILEELRRRLGDQQRPILELDYIERLLRRF